MGRGGIRQREGARSRRLRGRALLGTFLTLRLALAALLLVGLALSARYIVWPRTDEPAAADAVVVLGGGGGERVAEGIRLLERGYAPLLVVSHGTPELCAAGRVLCFVPDPDRTQGEARAAAALAAGRGWSRLVVVTSRYHAARAERLFRRCFDGEVAVVGAAPDSPLGLPSGRNLVWEWGGWAHALVVERGC